MNFGEFFPVIGGSGTPSRDREVLEILDPSEGGVVAAVQMCGAEEAHQAVQVSRKALLGAKWKEVSAAALGQRLYEIAELTRQCEEELVELDVHTAGLTPTTSRWGVRATAEQFRYYAGLVDKIEGTTIPVDASVLDYTLWEPLGVTLHILPWNAPMYLLGRSVAPALAARNAVIVKPAEQTAASALRWADRVLQAGLLPEGILNVVTGRGTVAGQALLTDSGIDEITFTGSVATGKHVMQQAALNITPVVLELGGKSPIIIFADADLDMAVQSVVKGAFDRAGQVCTAKTRLLVDKSVHRQVVESLRLLTERLRVGKAVDEPDVGPIVSAAQLERVQGYVEMGMEEGALLVCGGRPPDDPGLRNGFFLRPAIFDHVKNDSRLAQEEIFGPVLSVIDFADEEEAVDLANSVPYGLNAEVWTNNLQCAHRMAARLDAGRIGINGERLAAQVPGGGFKASGIGVEKGLHGIRNYMRLKNVSLLLT